jgi:transcriptional regulator with XRE-family HTH domain
MATTQLRLRELREARGWTQQDVAEQIARLAWLRCQERVGINADMVSKWERGAKRVSTRYRELLCMLYNTDGCTLGISPTVRPAPQPGVETGDGSLIDMLGGAASLLGQLGAAGTILQPRLFGVWKDELMQRRALLKLIGLATATGFVTAASETDAPQSGKPTPETTHDLDHLADRYQALYRSTPPAVLMTPVVAHLDIVRDLLRQGRPASTRRALLANRARVAILAGRLAFFDCGDAMSGRGYFNLALESARGAGDPLQGAAALAHMASIPAADQGYGAALDYLRAASDHVAMRPDNRVASWLCGIESEIQTNAGSHTAALVAIDQARDNLAKPGLNADLPWFDYFDETRLSGCAGYATLHAGRYEESHAALTMALEQLPNGAIKQRAVFLADVATVHLASGNLDEACRVAGDAVEQLHQAEYASGLTRLRRFRASVQQWSDSAPVRDLDERLAAIA